eukprot:7044171-Prymnesium_polylepis.2
MGGRHGHLILCRNQEPDGDAHEDAHVAVHEELRVALEAFVVRNALPNGVGHLAACKERAKEFEYDREDTGLLDRERLGADAGGVAAARGTIRAQQTFAHSKVASFGPWACRAHRSAYALATSLAPMPKAATKATVPANGTIQNHLRAEEERTAGYVCGRQTDGRILLALPVV